MNSAPVSFVSKEEFDIFDVWNRVWRRRWMVMGIAAGFVAAGVVHALLATPTYRGEVVIVEVRDDGMGGAAALVNQLGGLANIVGMDLSGSNSNKNGAQVLESRSLTEEFIKRYVPIDTIIEEPGPRQTLWYAVKQFRESALRIGQDQRAGKTTVSVEWKDPDIAARYANLYVALANEMVRSHTLTEAQRNIDYLEKQIDTTNVAELRRVMYNLIETETKRLMLANSRMEYAFRIIDPAVTPEQRASPRRARIVVTAGFVGSILGCMIALAADVFARRRKVLP